MATTIAAGTVTVKITETVSLNGSTYDATNVLTIPNVNEVSQRIVNLPGQTLIELFEFSGIQPGRGKFLKSDVQYLRITNLDDTNSIAVNTLSSSSNNWTLVTPSRSFILGAVSATMEADSDIIIHTPVLQDIDYIWVHGSSVDVIDLEFFVALT
jgi:hypothetical protein